MPDQKEKGEYRPFEWAEKLREEQATDLDMQENLRKEDLARQEEPTEQDFISDEADAADRLNQIKDVAKGQISQKIKEQVVKKVAKAAWKKFAVWFATTIGPYIVGTLLVLLVIFMVVVLTLYLKCQIVSYAGIFKPILSWVGITCDIPAGSGATTTNTAPATQ